MRYCISLLLIVAFANGAWAQQQPLSPSVAAPSSAWREDQDGVLERNEFITISPNGAVTRALCPYTCADRMLPTQSCRTWASKSNPAECYVWDTRLANDAVPLGPSSR